VEYLCVFNGDERASNAETAFCARVSVYAEYLSDRLLYTFDDTGGGWLNPQLFDLKRDSKKMKWPLICLFTGQNFGQRIDLST
jgi:hypothetical protein